MKVEIANKKENPLQERFEVRFSVEHTGEPTPARDAVKTSIASLMGVQKERVIIDSMDTEYGRGVSKGYAKVYQTQEAVIKSERHHLLVRNKLAEKKTKAKVAKKARAAPKAK